MTNSERHKLFYSLLFLVLTTLYIIVYIPFGVALKGETEPKANVALSAKSYLNGNFQQSLESQFEENLPARPGMIRLLNQGLFDVFHKTHSNLVIGPDGSLFEQNYLDEYSNVGSWSTFKLDSTIRAIQTWEAELTAQGKSVYLMIIPSKPRYYKTSIPKQWDLADEPHFEQIIHGLKSEGSNVLDLRMVMDSLENNSPYPVFPKYGIHWSRLAHQVAFQKFISVIDTISPFNHYDFKVTGIQEQNEYVGTEDDLWKVLNTWNNAPLESPMAKPNYSYEVTGDKHGLLLIGDSFYWSWFSTGLTLNQFNPSYFFYYNSTAHKAGKQASEPVTKELTERALEEVDIVVLMFTEINWTTIHL